MNNPLYMLTPKEIKPPEESSFKPEIITVDIMLTQEVDTTDYEALNELFIKQIGKSDEKVWNTLIKMGRRRPVIIKSIFEAAVFIVGVANTRLVNTIFANLTSESSSEDIVSLTDMMLKSKKKPGLLKEFIDEPEVTKPFRKRINGILNDTYTVSEAIDFCVGFINTDYRKLKYCDKEAQVYPLLIKFYFVDNKNYQKIKNKYDEKIRAPRDDLEKVVTTLDNMLK